MHSLECIHVYALIEHRIRNIREEPIWMARHSAGWYIERARVYGCIVCGTVVRTSQHPHIADCANNSARTTTVDDTNMSAVRQSAIAPDRIAVSEINDNVNLNNN